MDKEQAKKWINEINAFAEGKEIQLLIHGDVWQVTHSPDFSETCEYRIKPEPEVIYVNKHKCGEVWVHSSEEIARSYLTGADNYEYIAKKFIACDE